MVVEKTTCSIRIKCRHFGNKHLDFTFESVLLSFLHLTDIGNHLVISVISLIGDIVVHPEGSIP